MATVQSSTSIPTASAEYSGDKLTIFTVCFIPVQVICVGLRFFARYLVQASWGLDDVLVLISLISQLCLAGVSLGSAKNAGVGYHIPYPLETTPQKVTLLGKYLAALSIVYLSCCNIPKLAILALYLRLFPQKNVRIMINILVGLLIAQTISMLIAAIVACRPFAANWDPTLPGAVCITKEPLFIWSSFPNIITDIIMLILPIHIVWNLQINKRLKVRLTVTFMIGSLGFITSIIRFVTFFRKNSLIDGTWTAVDLIIWTQIEGGMYLLSACLATYRPLLERIGKRSSAFLFSYHKNSDGDNINIDNFRHDSPSIPLNSASRSRNLGNSSLGSSHIEDTPETGLCILVPTDIHMKWNGFTNEREGNQS